MENNFKDKFDREIYNVSTYNKHNDSSIRMYD